MRIPDPVSARRAAIGAVSAVVLVLTAAAPALAHEERTVAGYDLEVGFIGEPVFVGERSGLEIHVAKDGQPVTGLAATLRAQVVYADQSRDLSLTERDEEPGWYESVFIPTAAGPYTFHLTGTIGGQAIDERFTSSATGFAEVQESAAGQFPYVLPSTAQLEADAARGADAAAKLPLALGLGAAGAILGLLAFAVALAGRRRAAA